MWSMTSCTIPVGAVVVGAATTGASSGRGSIFLATTTGAGAGVVGFVTCAVRERGLSAGTNAGGGVTRGF